MLPTKGILEILLCVVQINLCLPTASSLYPQYPPHQETYVYKGCADSPDLERPLKVSLVLPL